MLSAEQSKKLIIKSNKHIVGMVIILFALSAAFLFGAIKNRSLTNTDIGTKAAASCALTAMLENPCRPLIGAVTGSYTMAEPTKTTLTATPAVQFPFFEKRLNDPSVLTNPTKSVTINKKIDVMHTYHANDSTSLNATELSYANRENTILHINYRPDSTSWANAGGSSATINTKIATLADNVKALGSKKIMISIWGEPEDDVNTGTFACTKTTNPPNIGTAAEYKQMWQNVRNIFSQRGANNVVWNMNYMGYSGFDCMVDALWPGNNLVDWVSWDPYTGGLTQSFESEVGHFYNLLSSKSNSTNNYLSKTWGLSEFGYWNQNGTSTDAQALVYWQQAKAAIINNKFPKLRMYTVFDTGVNEDLKFSSMVGMKFATGADPREVIPYIEEQTAYNDFATTILNRNELAQNCTISDKLVNSCRPWLGAFADKNFDAAADFKSQITEHERIIDKKLDIVHSYRPPTGNVPLANPSVNPEYDYLRRDNTILFISWKPVHKFTDITTIETKIRQTKQNFNNVKASDPTKKIMLGLYLEPEPQVSGGASGCPATGFYKGANGTTAEYRAMWQHVRTIFDDNQNGGKVTNVVWVMNYMGFANWNCMVDDLWPGNGLVDWVMWDPYSNRTDATRDTFEETVSRLYDHLVSTSDATHDYLSKPWGLAEFGIGGESKGPNQAQVYQFYDDAKRLVEENTRFPKLKAYVVFDQQGVHDTQIAWHPRIDTQGNYLDALNSITTVQANRVYDKDPMETAHYKAFANSPAFSSLAATVKNADLNNDSVVNILDLAILLSKWGTNSPSEDLNNDQKVNIIDLSMLLNKWT